MGCWWNLDGTVKPQNGKMDEAAKILFEYDCEFDSGLEEGTFDLSFSDERWHSFAGDLAKELAPLLLDGEIDAHNDDNDTYCRYSFHNGRYTCHTGDKFICFSGFEDDFAETLSDEIVRAVLRKYAATPDNLSVKTPDGEMHYLLFKDATEDREIKLKNLIGKRNRLLWNLECVENEILKVIEKHENEFREAFKHDLGSLNFDEWVGLEEFLEIPLTYEQYEAVADYCNNDAEIDGNILDIAAFEDRKADLLTVAKDAERTKR